MHEAVATLPTIEQFTEHLNSTFKGQLDDGQIFDLELFKVESTISNNMQEAFSLLFRAPLDIPPFQNIFHLEHAKIGKMDLFLVPIRQKDDCLVFEAVFNQLLV